MSLITIQELKNFRKKTNKNIGVTFSCFDLMHSGHMLMLKDSKNMCDVLVVGLQTDPTVDRPHKNKPVLSYDERLIIAQSIKYIDYIVEYTHESELLKILDDLKPDVRILGTDYLGKNFTGKDREIRVYYHNRDVHNYSTTTLRKRVYNAELENMNKNKLKNISDESKILNVQK